MGKVLANVASVVMKTNKKMLEILERDSEALQEQQRQFSTISNDFVTKYAYETQKTQPPVGQAFLVSAGITVTYNG